MSCSQCSPGRIGGGQSDVYTRGGRERGEARAAPQAQPNPQQVQEGSARAERPGLQNMELAPVQRKIEARSAEDSFTGFVRTLYFADTYLRDSECLGRGLPDWWCY